MAEDESKKGFAVQPKLDCPHLKEEDIAALLEMIETNQFDFSGFTCAVCKDKEENWICLQCR